MTDRVKGLYVVLDADYRVDDVEAIVSAIKMVKCVADVQTEDMVSDVDDYMARTRVRSELAKSLNTLVTDVLTQKS